MAVKNRYIVLLLQAVSALHLQSQHRLHACQLERQEMRQTENVKEQAVRVVYSAPCLVQLAR